jgi:hypothetical protein
MILSCGIEVEQQADPEASVEDFLVGLIADEEAPRGGCDNGAISVDTQPNTVPVRLKSVA